MNASNMNLTFKLFPNLTSANINVELPYTGNGNWYLMDISGKTIIASTTTQPSLI